MDRPDRVQVFKGDDGQWYARRRAANGRIICVTEGYTRRRSAVTAAQHLAAPAIPDFDL
jgi:uncharacterized protein YegP (UPF0339 family)